MANIHGISELPQSRPGRGGGGRRGMFGGGMMSMMSKFPCILINHKSFKEETKTQIYQKMHEKKHSEICLNLSVVQTSPGSSLLLLSPLWRLQYLP